MIMKGVAVINIPIIAGLVELEPVAISTKKSSQGTAVAIAFMSLG